MQMKCLLCEIAVMSPSSAGSSGAAARSAGRPGPRRPRPGAASVFPVPERRLAVIDLGAAEAADRNLVDQMAARLDWSPLLVTQAGELAWSLTVNRPAAVVVLQPRDLPPDLALVDRVRKATRAPIAVLAGLNGPQTTMALAAGADTVIAPSVRDEELGARLLALVRRAAEGSDAGARYLVSGRLRVDLWQREATLDHRPVPLTATELRLLVCLMEAGGHAVPASRIVARVWGWAGGDDGLNTLRITVARLRRKLGEGAGAQRFVVSVRGTGYRFGGQVTEVGEHEPRPGTSAEETGDELLLAERLARRCEELASAPDAELAAARVAEALIVEGSADAVGLHLLAGDRLQLVAHRGFSAAWEQAARELRLADTGYAAVRALTATEPLQLRRRQERQYPGTAELARTELPGTYLFVPLRSGNAVVGAMGVHRHSDEPFGPLTITYLRAVAALCGVCLETRWRAGTSAD